MADLNGVEIFTAGDQTDSVGRKRNWTEAELDTLISNYNPKTQEAPAVIGHPKDTAPAYGWVKRMYRKGLTLIADFGQVAPEFISALKEGRYKKRSISLSGGLNLRHVAFLGGAAPAVAGLKDIEFSASEEFETYEFTTNEGGAPEEDGNMNLEQALAEIERLKDEIKKLKEAGEVDKVKAAEDKATAAEQKLSDFMAKQETADLERRIDALVKDNKLLPGDKDKTLNFARAMDDGNATMDFSKGEGQTEKVSPREAYLRDLETSESHGLTEEFARADFAKSANSDGDDDCINFAAKM